MKRFEEHFREIGNPNFSKKHLKLISPEPETIIGIDEEDIKKIGYKYGLVGKNTAQDTDLLWIAREVLARGMKEKPKNKILQRLVFLHCDNYL